jgi:hypothetical protein
METILNNVADLLFWGSAALLVWGAVLALGQIFASGKPHSHAPAPHASNRPQGRLAAH